MLFVFFFKQKTAYEMRISDWSSDVCSSDLQDRTHLPVDLAIDPFWPPAPLERANNSVTIGNVIAEAFEREIERPVVVKRIAQFELEIGRASCRERVCQYG